MCNFKRHNISFYNITELLRSLLLVYLDEGM